MLTYIIRSARAALRREALALAAMEAASVFGWDAEIDEPLDSEGRGPDLVNLHDPDPQPDRDVTPTSTRTTS